MNWDSITHGISCIHLWCSWILCLVSRDSNIPDQSFRNGNKMILKYGSGKQNSGYHFQNIFLELFHFGNWKLFRYAFRKLEKLRNRFWKLEKFCITFRKPEKFQNMFRKPEKFRNMFQKPEKFWNMFWKLLKFRNKHVPETRKYSGTENFLNASRNGTKTLLTILYVIRDWMWILVATVWKELIWLSSYISDQIPELFFVGNTPPFLPNKLAKIHPLR